MSKFKKGDRVVYTGAFGNLEGFKRHRGWSFERCSWSGV